MLNVNVERVRISVFRIEIRFDQCYKNVPADIINLSCSSNIFLNKSRLIL